MSFGASPSDIIIVVTFCKALYRKCRDAGGEYDEISREVRGLHTVLRHLKYEVEAPDSPLNRDHSLWGRQLAPIIGDCDYTLRQLDGLIQKYGRLAPGGASPTSPRVLWDRVRFGSNEMDQLGEIRVKLISHKTSLTLFLDTIQLHQSGKMATALDNQTGQLDVILDKVDSIAARMGQRSGSVLTNYEDDDKEVWKQFRRELVAEGFSSDVLQQHKDVLRAYIREIDQKGLLDETPPDPKLLPPPTVMNTQRWLEDVQAPSVEAPPSSASVRTGSDDSGAKEMVNQEVNMKFPQSMKFERPKPESRQDGMIFNRAELSIPVLPKVPSKELPPQKQLTAIPKVVTSNDKEVHFFGIDDSSEEESSEFDDPSHHQRASNAVVIRTSDLLGPMQSLQVRQPTASTSFRSSQSSFTDDDGSRALAYRPKKGTEFGTSPSRHESFPVLPAGTKPRPAPLRLAPDIQGNEIPADAKWTKINRRLVSPEVLAQDKRRYEVRPDFVAVLGLLSRKEIEDYAARTYELRHFRRKGLRNGAPVQPLRPQRGSRESTPDDSDTMTSESDSDSDRPHHRHRHNNSHSRPIPAAGPSYTTKQPTYPLPYGGQAPLTPLWSPNTNSTNNPYIPAQHQRSPTWTPSHSPSAGQIFYTPPTLSSNEPVGEKEHRRRHSPHSHKHSHRDKDREREKERERTREKGKERSRRWKENLTAAGIGAAAVGLFETLAEAAEGIDL